jgi:hypothetical protein
MKGCKGIDDGVRALVADKPVIVNGGAQGVRVDAETAVK